MFLFIYNNIIYRCYQCNKGMLASKTYASLVLDYKLGVIRFWKDDTRLSCWRGNGNLMPKYPHIKDLQMTVLGEILNFDIQKQFFYVMYISHLTLYFVRWTLITKPIQFLVLPNLDWYFDIVMKQLFASSTDTTLPCAGNLANTEISQMALPWHLTFLFLLQSTIKLCSKQW